MNKHILGVTAMSCILVACVPHLNKQQCQSMNWYQVGYSDGTQGKLQRDLSQAIEDCAKFNLTVDTKRYTDGWRSGTRQFCHPSRAYQLGVTGSTFNHVCPSGLAAECDQG